VEDFFRSHLDLPLTDVSSQRTAHSQVPSANC
jgi:hypothetical protein